MKAWHIEIARGCLVNLKLFGTSTISQSFWEYKQEVINVKQLINPGMQPQGHQVLLLCKYARRDQSANIKRSNMHGWHCQLKINSNNYLSELSVWFSRMKRQGPSDDRVRQSTKSIYTLFKNNLMLSYRNTIPNLKSMDELFQSLQANGLITWNINWWGMQSTICKKRP